MSTAVQLSANENTIEEVQSDEDIVYRYCVSHTAGSLDSESRLRRPRPVTPTTSFAGQVEEIRQSWSGIVLDHDNQDLTVRLEDRTDPKNPDEIVTLSLEEIETRDQDLIQKGAMFLWHIGYRYGPKYPRERFSKIRFRRLPNWTEDEIEKSKQLAKEYADFFNTNSTGTT